VTSAFWGQIDSFLCLLCALVLLNMNLRRPRAAWLLFTLALLTKFQAVVLLPLLLVLTLRRHGWRTVGQGVALCGVVFVCVVLPFVFGSGLQNALRPFFQAVDLYPTTTVNAFNLWHVVNPSVWGSRPPLLFQDISDSVPIVASLTPKMLGLLLLGLYTILVCIVVWKQAGKPREFIWGAAMSFGFFMLPTEIHERYLQIAVVLTLFAVVQDSRMLVVTLGLLFTYSYNVIVPTHAPFEWLGVNLLFEVGDISLAAALFNVLLFIWTIRILLDDVPIRWSQGLRVLLASAGSLLLLAVFVSVLVPDSLPASAKRLDIRLGDSKRLEGYSLKKDEDVWTLTLYWQALAFDNVDYTLFVHTIKDGAKVSQRDERPQDGAYPTWRWYNNRLVPTALVIELPPGTRPDTLLTGLYEAGKMVNVPVVQNGQSVPDGRAVLCSGDC
jgi:hypothetical protein